jgi:hypothetical protein
MQSFNFTIQHRPGNKIPHADYIRSSICERPKHAERKLDYNSLEITDTKITNNAIPPERTEIDDYVDDKLMINSLLSENYFLDDDWRFENKMNINRRSWRKGKKKNVKVRFVDSSEDSDSRTNTSEDSNSDDSVQFVDGTDDSESHGTTTTESTDEEELIATSEDTETQNDSTDNESTTQEEIEDEERNIIPQEDINRKKIITKPMIAKTKKLLSRRILIYEKLGVDYPENRMDEQQSEESSVKG